MESVADETQDRVSRFGFQLHAYVRQFLQSGDQKAGFILAASSALLGFLGSPFADLRPGYAPCPYVLLRVIGIALTAAAVALAVRCVWPRQHELPGKLVSWKGVTEQHRNAEEYATAVRTAATIQPPPRDVLTDEVLCHSYELAKILRRKYRIMAGALGCFVAGGISAVILSVWKVLYQ